MLRFRCALTFAMLGPGTLAALTVARPAAAQSGDTDRQIAQQLFDDGRALLETRRYSEACTKFAESQRLDPGGGTLLNLANCHELEGKTATAWSSFATRSGRPSRTAARTARTSRARTSTRSRRC